MASSALGRPGPTTSQVIRSWLRSITIFFAFRYDPVEHAAQVVDLFFAFIVFISSNLNDLISSNSRYFASDVARPVIRTKN
jgi:hypothetical protein